VARDRLQNLILFSVENRILYSNYLKSVGNPVSVDKIQKFIDFPEKKPNETIAIWGVNPTRENERIWNSIRPNDIALFYRDKKYFAKATIVGKAQNDRIPRSLWKGDLFGKSMKLIVICKDVEEIDIDLDASIPLLVEPTMPQAYFFPIKKVSEDKINYLFSYFGSIDNALLFLSNSRDPGPMDLDLLGLSDSAKFELKKGIATQRRGQEKFRNNVLLNYGNECAICGIRNEDLLEASHIIPVIKQDLAGKLENGICFCALHHAMFDRGYFSFDTEYRLITSVTKLIDVGAINPIVDGIQMKMPKIPPSKELLKLHRIRFGIISTDQTDESP
jgi:hypothetical protein